eukprot:1922944-Prymnesium_polylepis.1
MELLRGSHKEPPPTQDIAWEELIDPKLVARATMAAGQFSLHHESVAHASGKNTSDGWRIGCVVRYMPCRTKSRYEETAMLARG